MDAHPLFAVSLVATAPSSPTAGTSLVVTASEGARFGSTFPFNAVICPANTLPTPANAEVVRITARSTDTFTIARTQEGSSARSVQVGDIIYVPPTPLAFTNIEKAVVQVCTSSTRPASPTVGMCIYETDTGNTLYYQSATTGWTPEWNVGWGSVATQVTWSSDTTFTTVADITNATITWTAVANRKYELRLMIHSFGSTVPSFNTIAFTDPSNSAKASFAAIVLSATIAGPAPCSYVESGIAAGSTTRKIRGTASAGTGHLYADATYLGRLSVFDVGPNGAPV